MLGSFEKGQLVRISSEFQDSTGAYIDPTVVKFDWRINSGTTTTYTYPTTIVKDATGKYHVDLDTSSPGSVPATYFVRFYSTGTGQAANEDSFEVRSDGNF